MSHNGYGGDSNPYAQNYATGGGASGAGGFFAGGGSQTDSPSSKRAGNNTLRPVTVRQILNAEQPHPDADFILDGAEVGQLTFVAVIRNVSKNATNISYSVEDGTGQIEVRQWLDSSSGDENSQRESDLRQNVYVRILGQLKSFQNRRSISAGHMRPVVDYNEVMFHRLEAVHDHLQRTRGEKGSQTNGGHEKAGARAEQNAYATNGKSNVMDAYEGFPTIDRKIMGILHEEAGDAETGISIALVTQRLKNGGHNLNQEAVKNAMLNLAEQGYVYDAGDEGHFLPCS